MSKMSALEAARAGYEGTSHAAARSALIEMMHAQAVMPEGPAMKAKAPGLN